MLQRLVSLFVVVFLCLPFGVCCLQCAVLWLLVMVGVLVDARLLLAVRCLLLFGDCCVLFVVCVFVCLCIIVVCGC